MHTKECDHDKETLIAGNTPIFDKGTKKKRRIFQKESYIW